MGTIPLKKNKKERQMHYLISIIGGFFGGFAMLNHHDLLASAQTSNLISLALAIVGRHPVQMLLHLGAFVLYVTGLALTVLIPKYTRLNLHICSVLIDMAALVSLAFIPPETEDFVAMYPIFFAVAFQWNSFKGADGYASSCIFSTNNLRQLTTSLVEYFCDKDKKHLHKSSFYGGTLLSFTMGVIISYFACKFFGVYGSFAGFLPALPALFLTIAETSTGKKFSLTLHKAA